MKPETQSRPARSHVLWRRAGAVAAVVAALGVVPAADTHAQCEVTRLVGAAGDELGRSVDVQGNRMVVSQGNKVRVLRWNVGYFVDEATLVLPRKVYAVAVHGDVVAAGAVHIPGSPQTFVYRFNGAAWELEASFERGDYPTAYRGRALDLHENIIAMGQESRCCTFVYRYTTGAWELDPGATDLCADSCGDFEGAAVAMDRNLLITGAPGWPRADIERYDGKWTIEGLYPLTMEPFLGRAVAISADVALVGYSGGTWVYRYAPGVDCNPSQEGQQGPWCRTSALSEELVAVDGSTLVTGDGGAIALRRDAPPMWPIADQLTPSDSVVFTSLAMDGNSVVGGDRLADTGGEDSGVAYAFVHAATFVNGAFGGEEVGTCRAPFDTVVEGIAAAAPGGLVVVAPGTYGVPATMNTPIRLRASGGLVRLVP